MSLTELLKSFEGKKSGGFDEVKFFQLKDDGDSAVVKILLADENDILKFTKPVHMVEINGFNNKVLCTATDSKGTGCECCQAGLKRTLKIMMPLFNNETQQIELWERGINQIKDLQTMLAEYGDLSQETFKIVRSGKAKSKDTKYSMVYVKKGIETDKTNADAPEITGRNFKLILDLTPEQQIEAMTTGKITWRKANAETEFASVEDDSIF